MRFDAPVVLDGGLSTELERRGHDISGRLWSARLAVDDPAAVVGVHADFARAGARVLTTASYQASVPGLLAAGFSRDDARRLIALGVTLARRGAEQAGVAATVAGSVGPYGAMLADGSEYTGAYAVSGAELAAFHHERMAVLAEAGADLLACETVPCVAEAEVLVSLLASLGVPGWLSLSTITRDGSVLTRRGEPAAEAFALARDAPEVVAVGVNCTDPAGVEAAVAVAAAASGKPVLVYPNSGETWDAAARAWRGVPGSDATLVQRWLRAGASGVGGCCRVRPVEIRQVAAALGSAASDGNVLLYGSAFAGIRRGLRG